MENKKDLFLGYLNDDEKIKVVKGNIYYNFLELIEKKNKEKGNEKYLILSNKNYFDLSKKNFIKNDICFYQDFFVKLFFNNIKFIKGINEKTSFLSFDELLFYIDKNIEKFNLTYLTYKEFNKKKIVLEIFNQLVEILNNGFNLSNLEKFNFDNKNKLADFFNILLSYEKYKKKNNYVDYFDVLNKLNDLFENNKTLDLNFSLNLLLDKDEIYFYNFNKLSKLEINIIFKILNLVFKNKVNIRVNFFILDEIDRVDEFEKKESKKNNFTINFFRKNLSCLKESDFKVYNFEGIIKVPKLIENIIFNNMYEKKDDKNLINLEKEIGNLNLIEVSNENNEKDFVFEKLIEINNFSKTEKKNIFIISKNKKTLQNIKDILIFYNENFSFLAKSINFNSKKIVLIKSLLNIIQEPYTADREFFYVFKNLLNLDNSTINLITRKASFSEKSIFKFLLNSIKEKDFGKNYLKIVDFKDKILDLNQFYIKTHNLELLIEKIYLVFDFYNFDNLDLVDFEKSELNNLLYILKYFLNYFKKPNLEKFILYLEFLENYNIEMYSKLSTFERFNFDNKKNEKFCKLNIGFKNLEIYLVEYDLIEVFDFSKIDYLFFMDMYENIFNKNNYIYDKNLLDKNKKKEFVNFNKWLFLTNHEIYFIYPKYDIYFRENRVFNLVKKLDLEKISYNNNLNILKGVLENRVKNLLIDEIKFSLKSNDFSHVKILINVYEKLFDENKKIKNNDKKLIEFNLDNQENKIYLKYKNLLENIEEFEAEENFFCDYDFSKHIYSVSQISTYKQCPKKYLYQYIYKLPTKPKPFFDFGTSIHSVLENILDNIDINVEKDIIYSKSIELFEKYWISKGYNSYKEEREYFLKGLDAIKNFINMQYFLLKKNNRKTIAKEKDFLINIEGKKIYGIIDRIDIVDDEYEILDYKTSNSMEDDKSLQKNIQLYVYALALKELYDKFPKRVGLWYLIFNKIKLLKFNDKNLELIKKEILDIILNIEKKNFKSNPSKFNCFFCDFSSICDNSFKEE